MQRRQLTPRSRQLPSLGVTDVHGGDLLIDQRDPVPGDAVALVQDLRGQPLLALGQDAEPRRLGRDGPPRGPHSPDDLGVLMADALLERQALEQVVEPGRLQHDADQVGPVGLIAADQLLRQHLLRMGLGRLELGQPGLGGGEL